MNATKIEQLEAQLASIQEELDKLKSLENSKNWPGAGDVYYSICWDGGVKSYMFEDHEYDQGAQAISNMFRTREEAEKELEARMVITELRSQPGRSKRFVVGEDNFCVDVDLKCVAVGVGCWGSIPQGFGQVYFSTEKDAENAIGTVGSDRILAAAKWLAMGV